MRDLIAIEKRSPQERLIIAKTLIEGALQELPCPKPETAQNVSNDDLVSRKMAIDAFYIQSDDDGWWTGTAEDMENLLKALPSAQSETCAYWDRESNICALHRPSAQQNLQLTCNQLATDSISRQAAIDAIDGGVSFMFIDAQKQGLPNQMDGSWFKAADVITTLEQLPPAQPERTCVNCGRTANNGGWYADGRTRCPIEEHYALPKDGYCHLWEKRNVTDDDYPERREE